MKLRVQMSPQIAQLQDHWGANLSSTESGANSDL